MAQYLNISNDGQIFIKWNITEMLEELNKIFMPVKHYDVDYLASNFNYGIDDTDYAMNTDITVPIIIAVVEDNKKILLDGNHRLYKAKMLKIEQLPCYVLPLEFHKKFIEDYDEELYRQGILIIP